MEMSMLDQSVVIKSGKSKSARQAQLLPTVMRKVVTHALEGIVTIAVEYGRTPFGHP